MEWTLVTCLLGLAAALRLGPLLRPRHRGPEQDRGVGLDGLAQRASSMREDSLTDAIDRYVVYLRRRERLLSVAEESLDDVREDIERTREALAVYLDESRRRGTRSRRRGLAFLRNLLAA